MTSYEPSFNNEPPHSKQWRQLSDAQRLRLLHSIFILHPDGKMLFQKIDQFAQEAADAMNTPLSAQRVMVITGEHAVGKTTFIERWLAWKEREYQSAALGNAFPSLSVSIPPSPGRGKIAEKHLLHALLSAAGKSTPSTLRAPSYTLYQHLRELLQTTPIHLMVLDRCEVLIEKQGQSLSSPLITFLREIVPSTHLSVILVGQTQEMEAALQSNPWLDRRITASHHLSPFLWDDPSQETVGAYRTFLYTIDCALPFDSSGLDEQTMASCLFSATNGSPGWTMTLIQSAATLALQERSTTISRACLAEAYQAGIANTPFGRGKVNPFLQESFTIFQKGRNAFLAEKEAQKYKACFFYEYTCSESERSNPEERK